MSETNFNVTESFGRLFLSGYKRLCLYACQFLHDRSICEDIVQDCFVKLWLKRENIDPVTAMGSLYEIVENACLDHLKKSGRLSSCEPHTHTTINEVIYAETLQHLYDLMQLPTGCCTIIQHVLMQDNDHQQAPEHLSMIENIDRDQKAKSIRFIRIKLKQC